MTWNVTYWSTGFAAPMRQSIQASNLIELADILDAQGILASHVIRIEQVARNI